MCEGYDPESNEIVNKYTNKYTLQFQTVPVLWSKRTRCHKRNWKTNLISAEELEKAVVEEMSNLVTTELSEILESVSSLIVTL